ncbi:MAG: DUF3187 family protein [Bdellovibrionales bacterium]
MSISFPWKATVLCGCVFGLSLSQQAKASRTSYRNAHPVGWMHLLPVGETPGWAASAWVNLELNHANIWNKEFSMLDRRNGSRYTYEADFEQSSAILEVGQALTPDVAFAVEVAYANRNGGFLDDFIDQFHTTINTERFLRHLNDDYGNTFRVQTNGEDRLATMSGQQGVGSVKAKLKWWLWKWQSPTAGVCDCGFAVSTQTKFPTRPRKSGLSSGTNDYSVLVHAGAPLWKYAGVWVTGAWTRLGANETFAGWPREEWQQMYELSLDLGLGPHLGILLQARTESPLFRRADLEFEHTEMGAAERASERVASGWNSLVEWRGSQAVALRWRWGRGSMINFMFIEDWGLGDMENRGDWLYVNNAPDVAFVSQWHLVF